MSKPEWKTHALRNSMKREVTVPREPVKRIKVNPELDLSPNEVKMFTELDVPVLLSAMDSPFNLYRMSVERVFRRNTKGPAVEALRRAYDAICDCRVFRHTPEFEKLLEF